MNNESVNQTLPRTSPAIPKAAGVVVPIQPTAFQRAAGWLFAALIRVISATLRVRVDDRSGFFNNPPVPQGIYCVWHNRLALCLVMYFTYPQPRSSGRGLAAMVSASKDGALLSTVLEAFRVQPIRGSTSRRGRQALLELTRWARRGYDLAITPDGPRGPRYQVQPGIISLAQITGMPILPFSYTLGWKLRVRSWDRFQVPLPFSTCVMIAGKPVHVPRESSEADREQLRRQLEENLQAITED